MTNTNDPFGAPASQEDTTPKTELNPQETPASSPDDLFADQLSSIRGDNGEPKYSSVEDALKALAHSQNFIATLQAEKRQQESELEKVKSELEKAKAIEDYLERSPATPPQPNTTVEGGEGLSEDKVADLVRQKIEEVKTSEMKQSNFNTVTKTLAEKFGDKAQEAVRAIAQKYHTTPERLREESYTNPQFVLSLFEGAEPISSQPSSPSKISTAPNTQDAPLHFDRGATRGGLTDRELAEMFRKSKEATNKRIGVE